MCLVCLFAWPPSFTGLGVNRKDRSDVSSFTIASVGRPKSKSTLGVKHQKPILALDFDCLWIMQQALVPASRSGYVLGTFRVGSGTVCNMLHCIVDAKTFLWNLPSDGHGQR